jgi:hypothetical protein
VGWFVVVCVTHDSPEGIEATCFSVGIICGFEQKINLAFFDRSAAAGPRKECDIGFVPVASMGFCARHEITPCKSDE